MELISFFCLLHLVEVSALLMFGFGGCDIYVLYGSIMISKFFCCFDVDFPYLVESAVKSFVVFSVFILRLLLVVHYGFRWRLCDDYITGICCDFYVF